MQKSYLFKIKLGQYDPDEYILVYAKNEDEARKKGAEKLRYNCGTQAKPKDLILVTYF